MRNNVNTKEGKITVIYTLIIYHTVRHFCSCLKSCRSITTHTYKGFSYLPVYSTRYFSLLNICKVINFGLSVIKNIKINGILDTLVILVSPAMEKTDIMFTV